MSSGVMPGAMEERRSSASSRSNNNSDSSDNAPRMRQSREWPSRIRDESLAARSEDDDDDNDEQDNHTRYDDESSSKGRMTARPSEAQAPTHPSQSVSGTVSQPAMMAMAGPSSTVEHNGLPHISVTDYSDRQRLLYQVTYLTTQLQRAQLQLQEQQRTILLLRAAARQAVAHDTATTTAKSQSEVNDVPMLSRRAQAPPPPMSCVESFASSTSSTHADINGVAQSDAGKMVQIRIAASALTAALLAAEEEKQLHEILQANLALFDPIIAQTQIHRLDNALAQLGLLREAELQRLRQAEQEISPLRTELASVKAELQTVRQQREELQELSTQQHSALEAATVEVQRLRAEELRLNRQMAEMEALREDGTLLGQVRLAQQRPTQTNNTLLLQCELEEQSARQALLQGIFFEPMLIAFDAGLTWMTDAAQLRATAGNKEEEEGDKHSVNAHVDEEDDHADDDVEEARLVVRSGIVTAASEVCDVLRAPATDVDLLLMRHQQEELTALRGRLELVQERLHRSQLEADRLRQLYESEQRRTETLAQTHAAQLQRAYDQVQKDGEVILRTLRTQVAEQVERAYNDGRREERRLWRLRERHRSDNNCSHHPRHAQSHNVNRPIEPAMTIERHHSTITSSPSSSFSARQSSSGSDSYICGEHKTPRNAPRQQQPQQRNVQATRKPTDTKMA